MGYDNTNKGVLFKNKKKEADNHPDYNGSINIDGTEYWLSAWINTTKDGMKYMALSKGEVREPKGGSSQNERTNHADNSFEDDDIPF